ncbi:MAG: hypothetical protein AB8E87_05820 [Prochlorococcus sp.]
MSPAYDLVIEQKGIIIKQIEASSRQMAWKLGKGRYKSQLIGVVYRESEDTAIPTSDM